MSIYKGDFLGFSIGNIHSSQLKIVRTSSGDRYKDNLIPSFKDITVDVPGGDGSYYFGTNYTNRKFQIDFAFDELTDYELKWLTQILSFKGVQNLVFDEAPYKKYKVRCAEPPDLNYLCFQGKNNTKIYKGEGTLNLISYYPFGMSDMFEINVEDYDSNSQPIINSGDLPIDNLRVRFKLNDIYSGCRFCLRHNSMGRLRDKQIIFNDDIFYYYYNHSTSSNPTIQINMKTHLIEYVQSYYDTERNQMDYKSVHICNYGITGDSNFFDIPVGSDYEICFYDDAPNRMGLAHGFSYLYRLIYY